MPHTPMDSDTLAEHFRDINERLLAEARERHKMNNQLAITFGNALDAVTASNKDLALTLESVRKMGEQVTRLNHWAMGVTGTNGVNSEVKNHTKQLHYHSRILNAGIGVVIVLNGLGIALLFYILNRLS